MKEYLEKIPAELKTLIAKARELAFARHIPIYLVGGFVRDLLLGVENLDLDIVVEADAIEFGGRFAQALRGRVVSHKRFGTATVTIAGRARIDFATARKEHYPEPASLPVVTPSTLRDDLARRDFTINAMAVSIGDDACGQLIDYCNGSVDLREKKIRALHPVSFIDDPTRILRAVRFERRYNFKIEKETLKYLQDAVSLHMLEKVSPQRVRDELVLLLKEKKPVSALKRLHALAGLHFIHKKLGLSKKTLRVCTAIERQVLWFKNTCVCRRPLDRWVMYCMALCDPLALADVEAFCARYMFLRGEQKRILGFKALDPCAVASLWKRHTTPAQVYAILKPLSYEGILVVKAKYSHACLQRNIRDFLARYNEARIHICGDDLIRIGLTPGPRYQKILNAILEARLNGAVCSKAEELRFARRLARSG